VRAAGYRSASVPSYVQSFLIFSSNFDHGQPKLSSNDDQFVFFVVNRCLCKGCAEIMRMQCDKCPICRQRTFRSNTQHDKIVFKTRFDVETYDFTFVLRTKQLFRACSRFAITRRRGKDLTRRPRRMLQMMALLSARQPLPRPRTSSKFVKVIVILGLVDSIF